MRGVAAEKNESEKFQLEWEAGRPWHALVSPGFVELVEEEAVNLQEGGDKIYRIGSGY